MLSHKLVLNVRFPGFFLSVLSLTNLQLGKGQSIRVFNKKPDGVLSTQSATKSLFKASLIIGRHKWVLALSYGLWDENPTLQYSLNTGVQWRFGDRCLGNFRDAAHLEDNRTKSQIVFMFSPMLTINFSTAAPSPKPVSPWQVLQY